MASSPLDVAAVLRGVPLFATVNDDAVSMLASRCRRRKFRTREALFHEGDPGHTLYVILSGRVNVEKTTTAGEVVHIAQRGPGEHVGELALVDESPRSADAFTEGLCELLMLDRADFLYCLERSPQLALSVIASLARRIREAAEKQTERQSLDVLGRLSTFLLGELEAAASRSDGAARICADLTQVEIAGRIGATRETVNRALARLVEVGAIRRSGREIRIANVDKLRIYSRG